MLTDRVMKKTKLENINKGATKVDGLLVEARLG